METQLPWFSGHSGVYKYLLTSLTAFSPTHSPLSCTILPHLSLFVVFVCFFVGGGLMTTLQFMGKIRSVRLSALISAVKKNKKENIGEKQKSNKSSIFSEYFAKHLSSLLISWQILLFVCFLLLLFFFLYLCNWSAKEKLRGDLINLHGKSMKDLKDSIDSIMSEVEILVEEKWLS